MQFTYQESDDVGRFCIRAKRDSGDEVLPVSALYFDKAPMSLSDDSVAVAATLAFGSFVRTQYVFQGAPQGQVLDAIRRVTNLPTRSVSTGDKFRDEPLRVTHLAVTDRGFASPHTPGVDVTRLILVPGDRFSGSLTGVKELVVGSNTWLVGNSVGRKRAYTAAAVLYANDFFAGRIEVDIAAIGDEPASGDSDIHQLCASLSIQA